MEAVGRREEAGVHSGAVVRRAAGQISCPLRDEVAILNLTNDTYYGLDAVGSRVWDLIAAPRQVSEVRDVLLAEFEVSPERCEQDLQRLITELRGAGLIEVVSEPPDAVSQPVAG
ncbi:MAG TPA: PqqD family peptide modification chaperone [Bryobacteraceae bacterium]|nr:PqqD family peptide modification chaperone [Bryobacteraceae bacterium]